MPPVLQRVAPIAGDPEDRFTALLGGDVFSHVTEVSFGSGIKVEFFAIVDDGNIEAKIRIDRDAMPGPRDVTLTDASGPGTLPAGFHVR